MNETNASAELLGQRDDDALGAADVAEPIAVLVLLQLGTCDTVVIDTPAASATSRITLLQHEHEARLHPGTACLVTMDRPFAFNQGQHTKAFAMTIPRREVDHRLNQPSGNASISVPARSAVAEDGIPIHAHCRYRLDSVD